MADTPRPTPSTSEVRCMTELWDPGVRSTCSGEVQPRKQHPASQARPGQAGQACPRVQSQRVQGPAGPLCPRLSPPLSLSSNCKSPDAWLHPQPSFSSTPNLPVPQPSSIPCLDEDRVARLIIPPPRHRFMPHSAEHAFLRARANRAASGG